MSDAIGRLLRRWKHGWIRGCAKLASHIFGSEDRSEKHAALVIPPASPGGLGDDALMTSLIEELRRNGYSEFRIGTWDVNDVWKVAPQAAYFPLPGRSIRSWLDLIQHVIETDATFILGADMLDGYYGVSHSLLLLRIADLAAQVKRPSTIVGASLSGNAAGEVRDFMKRMSSSVRLCARDPVSKRRMDEVTGRETVLVADIAFLLDCNETGEAVGAVTLGHWICEQRAAGAALIVGCNFNPVPLLKANRTEVDLLASYSNALARLSKVCGPIAVVMLPHDWRIPYSDATSLKKLSVLLDPAIPRNSDLLEGDHRAAELKAIAAQCDLIITGRMHLGIAALGVGVPTLFIGYQDKYDGLCEHFGLVSALINWDEATDSMRLSKLLTETVAARLSIAHSVAERLPDIEKLSRLNIREPIVEKAVPVTNVADLVSNAGNVKE